MPKTKSVFICQSCGYELVRWSGRCPQCQEWNTFVETAVSAPRSGARKPHEELKLLNLSVVGSTVASRLTTGISEFDRVLGGGMVPGSVILLAGEPGVGKSTLLLQLAAAISTQHEANELGAKELSALYVSGEESPSQLKLRAERLQIDTSNIQVLTETNVDSIISFVSGTSGTSGSSNSSLIVIDSVQTLATADLNAGAGTISQVRECSRRLAQVVKEMGVPLILVGHVTKEGAIAGPKVLEHLVDVVLYLEGDKFHAFRLLRAYKNRYGSDQEVGVFAMGERGLREIKNPSDAFLAERLKNAPGSVVTATMEGTRPVLVEIQALTSKTNMAYPRRTVSGFDYNRLLLITAVLQKRCQVNLQNQDIYVNVAGGFKVSEPAVDLACALAIVSSVKDKPIDSHTCVFGEVGLSGEIRKVSQSERRAKEARKLGFSKIISPESVRSVGEALKTLGKNS